MLKPHPVRWMAPQPLWGRFAAEGEAVGSASALQAEDQYRPALLRFSSDDFMPQVLSLLERDPKALGGYLARPETWRQPQAEPADAPDPLAAPRLPRPALALQRAKAARTKPGTVEAPPAQLTDPREKALGLPAPRELPLKLYQPVHQRHYLVGAGLVCGVAGLPERALATGGREQVGFVLRRLIPFDAQAPKEYACVKDARGARWQATGEAAATTLLDGEELLPLFSLAFTDDTGHARRVLAGTVPVGRRDDYMGLRVDDTAPEPKTGPAAPAAPVNSVAARKEQFKAEVGEPWKNLVRSAVKVEIAAEGLPMSDSPSASQKLASRRSANLQLQSQSWLVLLDFADYLALHLPDLWTRLQKAPDGSDPPPASDPARPLYQALCGAGMSVALKQALLDAKPGDTTKASLAAALAAVPAARAKLESTTAAYSAGSADADWPGFKFLLAGVDAFDKAAGPFTAFTKPAVATPAPVDGAFDVAEDEDAPGAAAASTAAARLQAAADRLDGLVKLVVAALPASTEQDGKAPPIPFAARLQREAIKKGDQVNDPGLFQIRCVYLRFDCGPLQPAVLSAPSQRFQLAGFFDPDAPARPIRIQLPLDATPAGLRKFNRNTAFQISDVLCGQMQRAKGLGLGDLVLSVLPWPFHKDLSVDLGDMGPCKSGGLNVGMICSLSIPIITICAFILLMMIVLVLDIIFRWIPYFVICFPLPGLKAKKGGP